ncbi:DUF6643 family protein [Streptomyces phaeofaciens]|uniref:Uncharacterized protein n=1 Tax=Streptomyces phaeofaciens TaxID=68254 RepID=A0A918HE91_9ACTN|nr:DUF6643 family protein [Streptomyces phaeofaciens]GGT54894.1 hypothetical protein GCM10010226_34840 [Streptomyces phaeofaciens]
MTSPRSTYGGYYSAFPDTPIYDSLVAERGTPQIAPIRVPAAYDTGMVGSNLPALPSALPALPAAPSQPMYGYPQAQQPSPLQQAPAAYIPPQATAPRGYPGPQMQQPRPAAPMGYEAMRPAAPRPAAPQYQDPYNNQQQYRGY